jgi:hypothetical protein
MPHFLYASIVGHLGWVYILAIVNSVAKNMALPMFIAALFTTSKLMETAMMPHN